MKATSAILAAAAMFVSIPFTGTPASAGEIMVNGGFETGSLSPWVWGRTQYASDPTNTANEWMVTSSTAYSGTYSAEVNDNFELVQNFAPVSVANIQNISFAALIPTGAMAFDLFYSGNVDEEYVVSGGSTWQTFDITSYLDHSQTALIGISFWGNTGSYGNPGNGTNLDDVSITAGVPEPATWAMLLAGFGALGFLARRAGRMGAVA